MTDQELKEIFEQEARLVSEDARIPAAGGVWWRSAMRARRDAADAAMRPMFVFQAVAAAAVIGALTAAVAMMWPALKGVVARGPMLQTLGAWAVPMVAVLGAFLVVPVVLYFALSERRSD